MHFKMLYFLQKMENKEKQQQYSLKGVKIGEMSQTIPQNISRCFVQLERLPTSEIQKYAKSVSSHPSTTKVEANKTGVKQNELNKTDNQVIQKNLDNVNENDAGTHYESLSDEEDDSSIEGDNSSIEGDDSSIVEDNTHHDTTMDSLNEEEDNDSEDDSFITVESAYHVSD